MSRRKPRPYVVLSEVQASMVLSQPDEPLASYLDLETAGRFSDAARAHESDMYSIDSCSDGLNLDEIASCIYVPPKKARGAK